MPTGPNKTILLFNTPHTVAGFGAPNDKPVGVGTLYIEPGSPWENGYAESFHGRFRDEFLAMKFFEGVRDARALTALWRDECNTQRPHRSLGYQTPAGFAAACGEVPCS